MLATSHPGAINCRSINEVGGDFAELIQSGSESLEFRRQERRDLGDGFHGQRAGGVVAFEIPRDTQLAIEPAPPRAASLPVLARDREWYGK